MGITSLWEDLEAKLLTPGQLLGYPWKLWGITVQTSYVEGWWHQNWASNRPTKKFAGGDRNEWKTEYFYSDLTPRHNTNSVVLITMWTTSSWLWCAPPAWLTSRPPPRPPCQNSWSWSPNSTFGYLFEWIYKSKKHSRTICPCPPMPPVLVHVM